MAGLKWDLISFYIKSRIEQLWEFSLGDLFLFLFRFVFVADIKKITFISSRMNANSELANGIQIDGYEYECGGLRMNDERE